MIMKAKAAVEDGVLDMVEFEELLQSTISLCAQCFDIMDRHRFDVDRRSRSTEPDKCEHRREHAGRRPERYKISHAVTVDVMMKLAMVMDTMVWRGSRSR